MVFGYIQDVLTTERFLFVGSGLSRLYIMREKMEVDLLTLHEK